SFVVVGKKNYDCCPELDSTVDGGDGSGSSVRGAGSVHRTATIDFFIAGIKSEICGNAAK
ncbi:hypothetical protein, partial [Cupriavidus sp. CuC1]|uniref:hypothetical protein n=1 Tax=Cupriavidus sp. CuC1 TaxID=3373131 RepID=UPI0037D0A04E